MKKSFLFAVAALSLVACTNETDVILPAADQPIAVKVVSQKSSRAAFDGTDLPVETSIFIGTFQKTASDYITYFSDAEFTCSNPDEPESNNRTWTGAATYPATGDLDFQAYTCDFGTDKKKPVATWTSDATAQEITGLSLNFEETPLNGKNDITYSEVFKAVRRAEVGGFANPSLKFYHSQAWVVVNFLASKSNVVAGQMKIRNVRVHNVNLTGNLNVTFDADGPHALWTAKGDADDYELPAYVDLGTAGKDFLDVAKISNKGILVLPTAEQAVSFEYCTRNGGEDANPIYTDWITYTTVPATTTNTSNKWEMAHKYIYNFSITSKQIEVTTQVVSFDNTDVNGNIQ